MTEKEFRNRMNNIRGAITTISNNINDLYNEFCNTQNTSELAATDSQQLQAVIADLSYVDSVIKEHGVVAGSKCHEMVARSVARLTAMQ